MYPQKSHPILQSTQSIAAASAEVLKHIYPDEADFLEDKVKEHQESRIWAGANFRSELLPEMIWGDT